MASGRLILPIVEPLLNASGVPDPGATLTVYDTGATDLSAIYADAALGTPILNPQTADAAGRFYDQATVIWADASIAYDCLVSFTDGSMLTFDQIYVLGASTNTTGFAPIDSPNFTGVPTAPTPATNDNSNKIATTAYVQNQGYATLASPAFTGTPTAPTAAPGTSTTQLATTQFVEEAIGGATGYFQSGEIAIANGSASTAVAHGLGAMPTRVQLYIRCKNANNGYPVGAEVPVNINVAYQGGDVKSEGGAAFAVSATNCGYVVGLDGLTCLALSPAGKQMSLGTAPGAPNWVMFIRAWSY